MEESTKVCHVVAMPSPGRGHINPMMNLCKQLSSRKPGILITFVLTEEWLGFIGSDPKPDNIRFRTIPNVVPSELVRGDDLPGFIEAVYNNLKAPFERLLDCLELTVTAIMADTFLCWVVGISNRRNIPVVSLWPMSARVLSVFLHFDLLIQNHHSPADLSERGDDRVDYFPGIPPIRLADLPSFLFETASPLLHKLHECTSSLSNARCLLLTSVSELESQVIDAIQAKLQFPVYPVGPSIPYSALEDEPPASTGLVNGTHHLQWLDSQPKGSVLYVSLGSFLSVSSTQMDEIVAGVNNSRVRFFWVARRDASRIKDELGDASSRGVVVPWCDQLKVLSHPSIGGFWSHCGWNSILEAVYAGVPMLAFPINMDQIPNCKQIVEDWKSGWRAKKAVLGPETLVTREEIAELVQKFMDLNNNEVIKMRKRARKLAEICQAAIAKGGSSDTNLDSFISDIYSQA